MQTTEAIAKIRADLQVRLAAGEQHVSVAELDEELHTLQKIAGDFPEDLQYVLRERVATRRRLAEINREQRGSERAKLLQGTLDDARSVLKILLALHGGGAVALLAFIGHLAALPAEPMVLQGLLLTMRWFGGGVALTTLGAGCAYHANLSFYRGGRRSKEGDRYRWWTVGVVLLALAFFLIALVRFYLALQRL